MRPFRLLALLLVTMSSVHAQTGSPPLQGLAPVPFISPKSVPMKWQIDEWSAHVSKCLRNYGPTRHPVSVSIIIGRDGKIMGEPVITSPIETDEFKKDVKSVVLALHRCEPLIVDPSGIAKGPFKQLFNFPARPN